MIAGKFFCTIVEKIWVTPSVMRIAFTTKKKIRFQPGQFLSIYVPDLTQHAKFLRRAYSFASPPELAAKDRYEMCVKYSPGGAGGEFLASLKAGDHFEATAPYGHFHFNPPHPGRFACFISTSTGIAPFVSIVLSNHFEQHRPDRTFFLFGARTSEEILYKKELERADVELTVAVSRPDPGFTGFHGRVTDYLQNLPPAWHWHNTDFYVCGNGKMIQDVCDILKGGHGVPQSAIFAESFFTKPKKSSVA